MATGAKNGPWSGLSYYQGHFYVAEGGTMDGGRLRRGQVVFMHNCHKCHPGGEAGSGPSINNIPLPGGMLRLRVRSRVFFLGIGRMPSFKKHEISPQELDDLVRYIKVLKKNKRSPA